MRKTKGWHGAKSMMCILRVDVFCVESVGAVLEMVPVVWQTPAVAGR